MSHQDPNSPTLPSHSKVAAAAQVPNPEAPTVLDDSGAGDGTLAGNGPAMPRSIGPYRIRSILGQGGMGAVYLGEQKEPVERLVAIKLIHASLTGPAALHRFDAERQAMARLTHPAIAQIFEGGTTDDGFPYFAMEHVPGESLTAYCDRRSLSFRDRLELVIEVCHGVEHAHRKGILHRDLKPSNILVTEVDGRAVPKVIDFGVAKAIDQPLTDATLQTGGAVGTPSYMSPEALDAADLDTRTDVYALGVILFELLVGQKPFNLKGLGLAQIFQRIQQKETPRPSHRFDTLPVINQEAIAEQRQQNRSQLLKSLQGDLDWILTKATTHDRDQRYGSATELAAELRRHLDFEPVLAGPPSTSYRVGKFVRRHRGLVLMGALLLLALLAGTVGTTLNMLRAQQEAERANRQAESTRQALLDAEDVTQFLIDLFEVSKPQDAGGDTLTARQLLDRGAQKVDDELADQPLRRARLMHTIGTIYNQLQVHKEAQRLVTSALELRRQAHADQDDQRGEVGDSLHRLAVIQRHLADYEAAEASAREAVDLRRQVEGPNHPTVGEASRELAVILYLSGRHDEAEPLAKEALKIAEDGLGRDSLAAADALETWGNLLQDQRRCADAVPHFERSLAIRRKALGAEDPRLSYALNNLGTCYGEAGELAKARPMFEQALAIQEKVLGPTAAPVAMARTNLAIIYRQLDEPALAEASLLRARDDLKATLGEDHPLVANCLAELGALLGAQGRLQEAEDALRQALALWNVKPGPDHPWTAWAHWGLANVLRDGGRMRQAETHYLQALEVRKKLLPAGHPELKDSILDYAKLLRATGRDGEADALEKQAAA